jgi:hypothetical protein
MRKPFHFLLAIACVVASCTKKDSESKSITTESSEPIAECFAYLSNKDSAFLHMNVEPDGIVTGDLEYKLFEKDQNRGRIEGKVNGDTLLANYKFMSEGTESTREIAFLKKEGSWVEGFGPVQEKDGAMQFSDRSKLDFSKGLVFKNAECP